MDFLRRGNPLPIVTTSPFVPVPALREGVVVFPISPLGIVTLSFGVLYTNATRLRS